MKHTNPARAALADAVNRAIANGSPVITEQPTGINERTAAAARAMLAALKAAETTLNNGAPITAGTRYNIRAAIAQAESAGIKGRSDPCPSIPPNRTAPSPIAGCGIAFQRRAFFASTNCRCATTS